MAIASASVNLVKSATDEEQDESVTQNPAGQELERPGVKCKAVDDALSFASASDDHRNVSS